MASNTPAAFLDITAFVLALDAFRSLRTEDDPHVKNAMGLLRRVQPELATAIEENLTAVVAKGKYSRFKHSVQVAARSTPGLEHAALQAEALRDLLSAMRSDNAMLSQVFVEDRVVAIARKVAVSAASESPETLLNGLAGLPSLSKFTTLRRWIVEAASLANVAPTEIENTIVDVTTAKNLGDELKSVDVRLSTLDPTSQEAADLQERRQGVLARIEAVADSSAAPVAVITAAATQAAQTSSHVTKTGAAQGLTPDQEQAMMLRGRGMIAAGAGSGKCVTGDTLVSTPEGLFRIDECAGRTSVLSVNAETLAFTVEPAQWLDMGTSPVIEIETRSGIRIRGTHEHPLLTWDGRATWKRLDQMQAQDFVMLRPGYALGTGSQKGDPDEAYLYGLFMGDGWVSRDSGAVAWSHGGDFLPGHFYALAKQFWGVTNLKSYKKDGTNSVTHQVSSVTLVKKLHSVGMAFSSARDKAVPTWLMGASDAERIRFLQGLFDTDGTATGGRVFEWLSASETLARQVQQLLLGLGIVGLMRPKHTDGYDHVYWRVTVSGDQLRLFRDKVGFRYDFKKSEDLDNLCCKDCNPNVGVYPHVSSLLKQIREDWKSAGRWNGRTQSVLMDDRWLTVKDYLLGKRNPSRNQVFRMLGDLDSNSAKALRDLMDYYCDEVVRVTALPEPERVYDFSVPTTHSFIANGIVSHNTRVIASKVVYHIKELGMPADAVMATSFTRKSAAELLERIETYGGPLPRHAESGFGTTHSIAYRLMQDYGAGRQDDDKGLKKYEQTTLVLLAMAQVEFEGGAHLPPPKPEGLFDNLKVIGGNTVAPPPPPPPPPPPGSGQNLTFMQALNLAKSRVRPGNSFYSRVLNSVFDRSDQYYFWRAKVSQNFTDPRGFLKTDNGTRAYNAMVEAMDSVGVHYDIATDPNLTRAKLAAPVKGKKKRERRLDKKYAAARGPLGQWFNLGLFLTRDGSEHGEPISPAQFKNAISKYKGRLVSPSEAWAEADASGDKRAEAAVYAAYEFLKGTNGEPDFAGKGDFDDVLIDVSKMMLTNPNTRAKIQSRFKFVMVDEAQDLNRCVSGDTEVQTLNGPVPVRDVQVGDRVLSFENGQVLHNRVLDKTRSSWTRGYRIRLTSGETILMSPNHRIYATALTTCPEDQMALYLMYREGFGFRIGTTRRLFQSRETSAGRAAQERADCAWVLEVGEPDDILYKEQALSLRHAIPTYIFEGTLRGCDQSRIDRIFQEFGENGRKLLAEYDLSFDYPHWQAPANDRGRVTRRVVNFCPHRGKGQNSVQRGSSVSMNWTTGDFDLDVPVYTIKGGRKMVGVHTTDYAEGRRVAQHVSEKTGARLTESLRIGDDSLPLTTASALFPGMRVPVWRNGVDIRSQDLLSVDDYRALASRYGIPADDLDGRSHVGKRAVHARIRQAQLLAGQPDVLPSIEDAVVDLVEIESVEMVDGGDYWDIAVENAHNFFGNGILSHNSQFMMFGLIAGYVDPEKAKNIGRVKKFGEIAKPDGSMSADTFCLIGDDKQCVDSDAIVDTDKGPVRVGALSVGDRIRSYRNGSVEFQTVKHAIPSGWTWGYRITTESGFALTMSPNHKLWASEPQTDEGQMAVYLMYRKDMGFRVGITNKGKAGVDDNGINFHGRAHNSYGGRAFKEKAERLWVLDIVEGREEAMLRELNYSLDYGIPTMVFGGENRGLNQSRIDQIFKKHGHKGARLLEERCLSFDRPHWMSQSYTKHNRQRHTVQFLAHSMSGSQVMMEWDGDKFDTVLSDVGVVSVGNRRRLRKYFRNYRDGLALAQDVASRTGANLSYRLATPEENLRETTASGLFVGMRVPVFDGESVTLDTIINVEKVDGGCFIDLDVDDASNFFANGILTHNSIYSFRGADPDAFIGMSDLIEGGAGFKTSLLKVNYRSGDEIVQAANRLIAHNTKQVPMVCEANPRRADQGAVTVTNFAPMPVGSRDFSEPAKWLANTIEDAMANSPPKSSYNAFGVGLRSNAEAYAYGLELLKKGIPFRAKANFFNDQTTKAMIHWLTIADEGINGNVDRLNAAVLEARLAPTSFLGKKFVDEVKSKASGNFLLWLADNGSQLYGQSNMIANVESYVGNLLRIANLSGTDMPAEAVLKTILEIVGADGSTLIDTMVTALEDDDEIMAEMISERKGVPPSEAEIRDRAMEPLAPLLGLLKSRANLTEAMKYVRSLQDVNSKITAKDDPDDPKFKQPAVTIGTIHSWKGLEVEQMFVPLVGGSFPRYDSDEEELASERRLMYVAVTRGQNKVEIMNIPTQTRNSINTSQFLDEMCLAGTRRQASMPSPFDPKELERYALIGNWGDTLFDADEALP